MSARTYALGLLGVVLLLLGVTAGAVWLVDPLQLFRRAEFYEPLIIADERTQNAGLLRNYPADSLLIGSSLSQACRSDQFEEQLGGKFLRLSSAGMTAKELAFYLEQRFKRERPARVYDIEYWFTFARENAAGFRDQYGAFPEHLYVFSAGDAARYLINFDNIALVRQIIAEKLGGKKIERVPFVERNSPEIDPKRKKGSASVVKLYRQIAFGKKPDAKFIAQERQRMIATFRDVYEPVIAANSNVEFHIVIPPFSIAYYQAFAKAGVYRLNTILLFREMLADLKGKYPNIRLHDFSTDRATVFDFDKYFDTHHFGAAVCASMASGIAAQPKGDSAEDVKANTQVLRQWVRETPPPA